jgi:hypothetical protein
MTWVFVSGQPSKPRERRPAREREREREGCNYCAVWRNVTDSSDSVGLGRWAVYLCRLESF